MPAQCDVHKWYDPDTVLREEANEIHTGKKPRVSRVPRALQMSPSSAATENATTVQPAAEGDKTGNEKAVPGKAAKAKPAKWDDIRPEKTGMELRIELYDRFSTALCLSGGGVRSASFNVGVIEALAVHPRPDTDVKKAGEAQATGPEKSLLSQFDYLSTVSGGGYIGSWFSTWIARDGYNKVWHKLIGRREKPEKEPPEIVWLRSYSNFLTPRRGLLSGDTWAAFALVIRNLVLNWLVIIPALCLALFAIKLGTVGAYWIPRTFDAPAQWLALRASKLGAIGPDWVSRAFAKPVGWLGLTPEDPALWLGLIATVPLVLALRYALANRPSCNPGIMELRGEKWIYVDRDDGRGSDTREDDEAGRVGTGGSEKRFKLACLLLVLISAFLFSLCLAVRYFHFARYTLFVAAFWIGVIGVGIYAAAWLIARVQVFLRCNHNRLEKKGWWHWLRDFAAWLGAGAVFGVSVGVGMHILATTLGAAEIQQLSDKVCAAANICLGLQTLATLVLLVVGVPWIITAQLTAEMIFVGLTNWQAGSDADREWFGRSTGWFTVTAIAWFFVVILVVLGPPLVALLFAKFTWAKYGTFILGAGSAVASTLLGKSGKTSASDQGPQKSPRWMRLILPVSTVVFLICLVLAVSAAMDHLLFGHLLVESPLLGLDDANVLRCDRFWLLAGIVIVGVVGGFAWGCININRFSIHSLYRNRLIRGYLGASNAKRAPNPFTGFDEKDNIRMTALWSREPKDGKQPGKDGEPANKICRAFHAMISKLWSKKDEQLEKNGQQLDKSNEQLDKSWRPFHVVNIALNVVNSKRLAWQERKAESFTVSPLHCGTAANELGYRPTCKYGNAKEGGITLGTALAISGAAASPNMGYNSSPLVTLLLALFNVRLGWWLGNPGKAHDNTYTEDGPRVAIAPFLSEMFGRTSDDRAFVYLSDGGHFENLGLYEMIRRRCRCIVISDAGCDPDYDFTDLGNAVRKIAIDLGIYISFSDLREIKRRAKDNTVIKGAYYAIGEIDYKTAPERDPHADKETVENGYILYIKPSYFGTESAGIVSYAAANAAFPHEPTFELFYGESQFESYRTLGFEILDTVLKEAKTKAKKIMEDDKATWSPSVESLCDLIAALAPGAKTTNAPRLSDALKLLDKDDLEDVRTLLAPSKT
jgi:hypothetical protein